MWPSFLISNSKMALTELLLTFEKKVTLLKSCLGVRNVSSQGDHTGFKKGLRYGIITDNSDASGLTLAKIFSCLNPVTTLPGLSTKLGKLDLSLFI